MSKRPSIPCSSSLHPFRCGRLSGLAHPQLISLFRTMPRIACLPTEADTTVYQHHINIVRDVRLASDKQLPWSRLVAKQFGWRGIQHYFFSPFKRTKAMKAYRTAGHLLAHQLGTPLPLGVLEERHWGFVQYNAYVTEAITGAMTLSEYDETRPDGPQGIDEVLRLTATYTRTMHDSGLWHRDLNLANFLLTGQPGNRQLYLVDLNRARSLPYVPMYFRAMDIARLGWRDWQPQFVTLYCGEQLSATGLLRRIHLYRRWRTWRGRMRQLIKPLRRWLRV